VLYSIDKLLSQNIVKDVEPATFVDAIKLGRNEYLEKLFSKNERNKLFATDISQDLTPLMLSVISGEKCEGVNSKAEEKKTYEKAKPVLHDYEMTFLMLSRIRRRIFYRRMDLIPIGIFCISAAFPRRRMSRES